MVRYPTNDKKFPSLMQAGKTITVTTGWAGVLARRFYKAL